MPCKECQTIFISTFVVGVCYDVVMTTYTQQTKTYSGVSLTTLAKLLGISKQRTHIIASAAGFRIVQQGKGCRPTIYNVDDVDSYFVSRAESAWASATTEDARVKRLRQGQVLTSVRRPS